MDDEILRPVWTDDHAVVALESTRRGRSAISDGIVGSRDERSARAARRLCYFAHFHPHGIVAPHVVHYLNAIRREGFTVIVVSTAVLSEVESARLRRHCDILVVRDNHGLGFGSWMEAYHRYPRHEAEFLLLANDSVYAPIGDFSEFSGA